MIAIFRDDFRYYTVLVFPIRVSGDANIGATLHDVGKLDLGTVWEPLSKIDDRIEDREKHKKLYKEIISKTNKEQRKELMSMILDGEVNI